VAAHGAVALVLQRSPPVAVGAGRYAASRSDKSINGI
jgi:hypothetical protein